MDSQNSIESLLDESTVENWSCEKISQWLREHRLSRLVAPFREQEIDGETLLLLTVADIKENFTDAKLGERKRLLHQIDLLRAKYNYYKSSTSSPVHQQSQMEYQFTQSDDPSPWEMDKFDRLPQAQIDNGNFLEHASRSSQNSPPNLTPRSELRLKNTDQDLDDLEIQLSGYAEEGIKNLVAVLYAFACFTITSYVMVCSAERAPDRGKYPPLPDIILDSLPYMPWAFALSEYCVFVEMLAVGFILLFHRYRQIVFRRGLTIAGSLFLLRCLTMFVTSLSVPNKHRECTNLFEAYEDGVPTFRKRLKIALDISLGMGLSTMGVHTCGDYMFSGHTAMLTLLNHLITEYGPKWVWLHGGAWLLNAFGAFFVLASHEHYTLDVVVALYITSRMFIYYHQLASTGPSRWRSRKDQHVKYSNFPLFWFFEGNIPGPVPNVYENPIQAMRRSWRRLMGKSPTTSPRDLKKSKDKKRR